MRTTEQILADQRKQLEPTQKEINAALTKCLRAYEALIADPEGQ